MNKHFSIIGLTMLGLAALPAAAQESGMSGMTGMGGMSGMAGMAALSEMAQKGKELFATPAKGGCVACHGKDANTPLLPVYPRLAGQNKGYLLQQMKDIKSGARNNGQTAAMKGVMHMVNDEEMEAMAEWLSTLR
jgi:cytochrome c